LPLSDAKITKVSIAGQNCNDTARRIELHARSVDEPEGPRLGEETDNFVPDCKSNSIKLASKVEKPKWAGDN
jgi:hypothetical protein